jgi:hypothetical protein
MKVKRYRLECLCCAGRYLSLDERGEVVRYKDVKHFLESKCGGNYDIKN